MKQEKKMKKIGLKATAVALALGLAVAGMTPASAAGALSGGGASFQADFADKCLARFNTAGVKVNKGITVSYANVGSGAGRTGLGNGTYEYAGTDGLGATGTLTAANSVYFPVAGAPMAVFVNLKSSTNTKITALRLDAPTIEGIFTGTIDMWNAAEIKALNPAVKLPNLAITTVTRSDKSGTTGNFKSYLKQNVPGSTLVAGNEFPEGFAQDVPSNTSPVLVANVAAANGRIGYADLSDVTSAVTKVSVKNKFGEFVLPSPTAAANYLKATGVLTPKIADTISVHGGMYNVDFTKSVKSAYQISFITYMAGNKSLDNTDLKVYANYVLTKCAPNPGSIGATGYTTIGAALIKVSQAQVAKL